MNTTAKLSSVLLLAAALSACGRADVSATNPAPFETQPSSKPTPVATATWAPGVYVAAHDGNDSNPGTPDAPLRTIDAALSKSPTNVYLFGGDENGFYPEIVVLKQPINLHGGYCRTAPMVVDTSNCRTTIGGGSPSLIVDHVTDPTTIENLSIEGTDAVQNDGSTSTGSFFSIPTIGCIGRGITPMSAGYLSCSGPGVDAQKRTIPQSSMAVAMVASSHVVFAHDDIVAGNAASGLAGADGAKGNDGGAGANGGNAALNQTTVGGIGGAAGVNTACSAAGTAGGAGGHFNAVSVIAISGKFNTMPQGYSGWNSMNNGNSLGSGAGGVFDWQNQEGAPGGAGESATSPAFDGADATAATTDVDVDLLVAGTGSNGANGFDGLGGTGGGGGAPGTVVVSERVDANRNLSSSGSFQQFGISGSTTTNSSLATMANKGETPAGGGGGGGAGGCGGQGGFGGQGGASSVGAFLSDSSASFPGSLIVTGNGGKGGAGGKGGIGGVGGAGGQPGNGASTAAKNESDTVSSNGSTGFSFLDILGSHSSWTSDTTITETTSASQGGIGGHGADGQQGGIGGAGAGGAGGATIGVVMKGLGSSAEVLDATIQFGTPGMGGSPNGPSGMQTATYQVY